MSDAVYQVTILPEARRDIRNIVLYIARKLAAPQAALNLHDAFQKEIGTLSCMPYRFRTIGEQPWGDSGVRKIKVKNYYVYFWIDEPEKIVKVFAVIYSGRDQKRQLKERKI